MRLNQIPMAVWLCFAIAVGAAADNTVGKDKPAFTPRDQRYHIQPNDVVEVHFRYTPEYNLTATVEPDGFISIEVVGDVKIAGLTLVDASAAIAKQAGMRLKDPEVTVHLKDFVKPHFVVAGEVNHPGTYELRGQVTTIQAIAMSGGFKESSKESKVILLRRINEEYAEVKVIDLKKLMSPSKIREDITLRADDMLVVPRNMISRLEPVVRVGSMGLYGIALGLR
jgi:polysaccharide export outer membrane protein